jgi:hypothetical protein
MKKFFKSLLTAEGDISSKRITAIFTLINILIMAWIATINADKYVTPQFMYEALAMVVAGGLGLTVLEKIFKKTDDSSNDQLGKN